MIDHLSDEDLLEAYREAKRQLYKDSLYLTAKNLLGYTDVTSYTHRDMIRVLTSDSKRKLIVMPRGTFKSSISCVSYPIWLLLRNPNLRIFIESETFANAKNFLREIKSHLQSEKITELFGEFKTDHNWNEGEITIQQRTKVFPQASITIGAINVVKVGQHYDVMIMDDLNSGNNSETSEMRQKVIRHFQMNQAILEPEGIMVVVGTRYAVDDVIGFVLQNEKCRIKQ